jgi:perosamine synthetase
MFIPVNEPLLLGNEKKYLNECIETGWISSEGPFVQKFEKKFAERVNRKFGIAVCNGTAALDVAVRVLEISDGDEIIMPTFTIISCAAAIVRAGGVPILVDCEADTWNMNVNQIEEKITPKTKAIMAVHIYGLPVDMDPVLDLAKKYNLKIIEDAAEAIGQTYKNKPCGSFGDIGIVSFYPNKHITTGEGGMVLTNDHNLAKRCRSLRNLCFQQNSRFVHEELGFNYRMTNLQAALGLAQLERLDSFLEKKKLIGKLYTSKLKQISGLKLPLKKTPYAENLYWVYGLVLQNHTFCEAETERGEGGGEEVMRKLQKLGVGTRPFFWPMHEQPVFRKMGLFKGEKYSVSENIARRGFYIPGGLALTVEQIDYVVKKLKEIL